MNRKKLLIITMAAVLFMSTAAMGCGKSKTSQGITADGEAQAAQEITTKDEKSAEEEKAAADQKALEEYENNIGGFNDEIKKLTITLPGIENKEENPLVSAANFRPEDCEELANKLGLKTYRSQASGPIVDAGSFEDSMTFGAWFNKEEYLTGFRYTLNSPDDKEFQKLKENLIKDLGEPTIEENATRRRMHWGVYKNTGTIIYSLISLDKSKTNNFFELNIGFMQPRDYQDN